VSGDAFRPVIVDVVREGAFEIGTHVVGGRFKLLLLGLLLLLAGRLGSADAAVMSLVGLRFGGC